MSAGLVIRPLVRSDLAAFRALRQEALLLHPDAFGASAADEALLSDEQFATRIPEVRPDATFGAFQGDVLVGTAGFIVQRGAKERHKAAVWGVYVSPAVRGLGVAEALIRTVVDHARTVEGLELLQLCVAFHNDAARRLYDRLGFVPYGVERGALRLGPGHYVDEELRVLDLGRA
jgi:ribosomal protein S18 acetylase RimI-like enzyme